MSDGEKRPVGVALATSSGTSRKKYENGNGFLTNYPTWSSSAFIFRVRIFRLLLMNTTDMPYKQMQHGKEQWEDKAHAICTALSFVLFNAACIYYFASYATAPGVNNNGEGALIADNRVFQTSKSYYNMTQHEMWHEQVKICSRLTNAVHVLSDDHPIPLVQIPNNGSAEFVYCVATKMNRSLSDNMKQFVNGNNKIADLRIGSGPQTKKSVTRALFKAVREAYQAIASGILPIITIRVNSQNQHYVDQLAMLVELDRCREAVSKACVAVCDAAKGAC